MTQEQINKVSSQIFNQARRGTSYNPGLPIPLSNLLVAQAKHETGNFTSNAFLRHNNAFGYAYYNGSNYQNDQGIDVVSDNGRPVAEYNNVEDSVKEVIDWIYRRARQGKFPADLALVQTPEQYAKLLKDAGYYGDTLSNYLNGLKRFFVATAPVSVALVVGVAAVLYYFRKQIF